MIFAFYIATISSLWAVPAGLFSNPIEALTGGSHVAQSLHTIAANRTGPSFSTYIVSIGDLVSEEHRAHESVVDTKSAFLDMIETHRCLEAEIKRLKFLQDLQAWEDRYFYGISGFSTFSPVHAPAPQEITMHPRKP